MYATIQKWGNSNAIRLPKNLLDTLDIRENDRMSIKPLNDGIFIQKTTAKKHQTLEERLVAFYKKPIEQIDRIDDAEYDFGKPKGAEIW